MNSLVSVILAGGTGTRLWPLSRKLFPKQFLALYGDKTMLQQTWERVASLQNVPPIVVCHEEQSIHRRGTVAAVRRGTRAHPARAGRTQYGARDLRRGIDRYC